MQKTDVDRFHIYPPPRPARSLAQLCAVCRATSMSAHAGQDQVKAEVSFFRGKRDGSVSHTERMKWRIDSGQGKRMIGARFATVEPVFGNMRNNKRLDRFTLRGRTKVDGQWKLFCIAHTIEKLGHHGYANLVSRRAANAPIGYSGAAL